MTCADASGGEEEAGRKERAFMAIYQGRPCSFRVVLTRRT